MRVHSLCVQADVVTINQRPLELQLLQASTGVAMLWQVACQAASRAEMACRACLKCTVMPRMAHRRVWLCISLRLLLVCRHFLVAQQQQQQQHEPGHLAAILFSTLLGRKLRGPVCSLCCLTGSDLLPPLPRMLCRAAWRTGMRSRRQRRRRMRPTRRLRWVGWRGRTWLCSRWVKQARSGQPGAHLVSDPWSFTSLPHCSVCIDAGGGSDQEAAHRSAGELLQGVRDWGEMPRRSMGTG